MNMRNTGAVSVALFAFTALVAGCGQNSSGDATPATTTTSTTTVIHEPVPASPSSATATSLAMPATPVPARTDNTNAGMGGATGMQQQIADQISQEIIRNTQMTGSRVTPVADAAGVVTLSGFVQNQQQKALAAKAAQETTGVTSVKNKLEIRPTGGTGAATPAPMTRRTHMDDNGGNQTTVVIMPPAKADNSNNTSPSPMPSPATPPSQGDGSDGNNNTNSNGNDSETNSTQPR